VEIMCRQLDKEWEGQFAAAVALEEETALKTILPVARYP
jgi:hypothetical protein